MLHPVANIVVADYVLIGVMVAPGNRQFLHVETGLLQFLDGRFGSRVRWIDCHDGIVLVHAFPFAVGFIMRR